MASKHWLKLQKKGKQPVTLKDPSVSSSDIPGQTNEQSRPKDTHNVKGKKKASPSLELSEGEAVSREASGDDEDIADLPSADGDNEQLENSSGSQAEGDTSELPPARSSATESKITH